MEHQNLFICRFSDILTHCNSQPFICEAKHRKITDKKSAHETETHEKMYLNEKDEDEGTLAG